MPPKGFDIILSAVNSYIGSTGEADWDTYNCACFIHDAILKHGYKITEGEFGTSLTKEEYEREMRGEIQRTGGG